MRLRTVSPNQSGWTRRRAGRGFVYVDADGLRLCDLDIQRCRELVIPPAWREVWICQYANGHIQATGTDDAGRRQYLYHPEWRRKRDEAKHDRVLILARRLPKARSRVASDLQLPGMPRDKALATAFRLLDLGLFRVGGEEYAEENDSYGLATLRKDHVRMQGGRVMFEFMAKSGQEQLVSVPDDSVRAAVQTLRRRRDVSEELLAWRDRAGWHDISSGDINAYLKEVIGSDVSAKDFRTWHATVLAAVALAVSTHAADTPAARKRAIARAMREVGDYLGNSPAVARASYVDPRVIDLFEDGITIEPTLRRIGEGVDDGSPATHGLAEQAVLRLLRRAPLAKARARRSEHKMRR
jgi:DNA topoisomerase-1